MKLFIKTDEKLVKAGPKLPQAPSQPKGASAEPAQPLKVPGAAKQPSGISYEYWKGEGAPPSEGGWESYQKKDGGMGYRRPLGSGGGGSQPQEQEQQGQVQQSEIQEQEPPKPEHVSDPLTHDDGSKVGEEPLEMEPVDNQDDGFEADPWEEERAPIPEEDQAKVNAVFDRFETSLAEKKKKDQKTSSNKQRLAGLGDLRQRNVDRAEGRKEVDNIIAELRPESMLDKPDARGSSANEQRAKEVLDNISGRSKGRGVPAVSPKLREELEDRKNPFLLTRKKNAQPQQEAAPQEKPVAQEPVEETVEPKVSPDDIKAAHERKAEVENMEKDHSSKEEEFKQVTKDHKKTIKDIDKDISTKQKEIKTLEGQESVVRTHKRKVDSLVKKKNSIESRIKKVKSSGSLNSVLNVKELEKQRDGVVKELDSAQSEFKKHKDKLGENKKKISSLKKEISGFEKNKKTAEKEHSAKEKEVSESKKTVESAKEEVAQNKNTKYKLPETDDEVLDHRSHTSHAQNMIDVINSHLQDNNSDDYEELQQLKRIYQEQGNIQHMPTSEDRQALKRANTYAKNNGFDRHKDDIESENLANERKTLEKEAKTAEKESAAVEKEKAKREAGIAKQQRKAGIEPPSQKAAAKQERAASKEHVQNNRRGSPLMSKYNSGRSTGAAVSHATVSNEGGASVMGGMLDFGSSGVVSAGHALLSSSGNKREPSEKKDNSKENNINKQRLEEAQKGMRLYLDLKKAIGPRPNVSVNSDKSPEEREEDYNSSFDKPTAGTEAGGDPTNSPGNGRKMNEKGGEDGVAKGFFTWDQTFSDMRKSLGSLDSGVHPLEEEFSKSVLGGKRIIVGRNRSLFSDYACDKLQKSLSDLIHKV